MDKLSEIKMLIRACAEMYVNKRHPDESKKSLSDRDSEYSAMWDKVVELRPVVGLTSEQTDEIFKEEYNKLRK